MKEADLVSRIGFGCAKLFRTPSSSKRQQLLNTAFDCGITQFDVARMYGLGEAEAELGRFLKERRGKVKVSSKFGIAVHKSSALRFMAQHFGRLLLRAVPSIRKRIDRASTNLYSPKDFSVDFAEESLTKSLTQLGIEKIENYFLHEPTTMDSIPLDTFEWLQMQRQRGLIESFGVSGDLKHSILAPTIRLYEWPILQFSYNILSDHRLLANVPKDREITTYSAISGAFDRFDSCIRSDENFRIQCGQRFGGNPTDDIEIAAILIRSNLQAIPKSKVLFSTSSPNRLRRVLDRVQELQLDQDSLNWLQNELILRSRENTTT